MIPTPDTTRPAAGAAEAEKLSAAIMNLPCKHGDWSGENGNMAYKIGHRDARHAAAELVLAASPFAGAAPVVPAALTEGGADA